MKILLSLLFWVAFVCADAQEPAFFNLLGKNEQQIKVYMKQTSGVLKVDRFISGAFGTPTHKHMIYVFPSPAIDKNGIYNMVFMLTSNGNCFQHMIWYENDRPLINIISQFDKKDSGLKRMGKDLKWQKKNVSVEISKITSSDTLKKGAFSVQWKSID